MLLKPGNENTELTWLIFPGLDKIVHFLIFAVLAFLFFLALPKIRTIGFILIIIFYAIGTEILQNIMGFGRAMEFWDVVADLSGSVLGYLLAILLFKKN